jgi:hypothetical protein
MADSIALRAEAAIDYGRLLEWAERIRNAETPSAPLIQRPLPDGDRLGYPSAVQAYREINQLVDVL